MAGHVENNVVLRLVQMMQLFQWELVGPGMTHPNHWDKLPAKLCRTQPDLIDELPYTGVPTSSMHQPWLL
jgi:hypothetical protein